MSNSYFSTLIKLFTRQRYTPETEQKVQRWLIEDENQSSKEQEMQNFWESLDLEADKSVYQSLDKVNKKLNIPPQKRTIRSVYYLKVAAVLLPLLLMAGFVAYYSHTPQDLILITVDHGQSREITLPDQSTVRINSGSTLEYPRKFKKKERTVYLKGEAYFSVKKDPSKPFKVKTETLDIHVLGTEFNLSAYGTDRFSSVFVKTGKVQVTIGENKDYILTPSRQLIYNKVSSEVIIETMNPNYNSEWLNGILVFEKKTIQEIVHILERTYNVGFHGAASLLQNPTQYTVKFVNRESLEQILHVLEAMTPYTYTLDGNQIEIHPRAH